MKPEILRLSLQKPLEQQGRKELGVGNEAHCQVLFLAGDQGFSKIGHRKNRIYNQLIFNGKAPCSIEIIGFKDLFPYLIDLNFRIIDAVVPETPVFIFDGPEQRLY